ncbi:MAG TPA: type II toxin-antitoxin system VapC family toxin [Candidatus Acidoferrales bacterium]|jgi:predicted nucleic acid-binding protein|nr:type II toxin-antitoxin system VapC family toxin [Candidatus Acidoferrales bacterium]
MAIKVLDSWALIAFFENEPAAEQVEILLAKAEAGTHNLLLSAVNWGEIYYNTMREVSQIAAERTVKEISGLAIEIVGVSDTNLDYVRQAAIYKATRRLSYADAFAAALAKIRNAELVTGDREFKQVEDEIDIAWLR